MEPVPVSSIAKHVIRHTCTRNINAQRQFVVAAEQNIITMEKTVTLVSLIKSS